MRQESGVAGKNSADLDTESTFMIRFSEMVNIKLNIVDEMN